MKALNYSLISALVLVVMTLGISSSCNKDKTPVLVPIPTDCPDTISFSGIIEPMIQLNCSTSGCHSAASAAAGYDLEGHANISANAAIILNVIRHDVGFTQMPYFQPKLNDTIIQQYTCWMDQGKLNN